MTITSINPSKNVLPAFRAVVSEGRPRRRKWPRMRPRRHPDIGLRTFFVGNCPSRKCSKTCVCRGSVKVTQRRSSNSAGPVGKAGKGYHPAYQWRALSLSLSDWSPPPLLC